jgi:hypothetical protein
MEEQMLNQVRVVAKDQAITVWVHQKTAIRLRTGKKYNKFVPSTEVNSLPFNVVNTTPEYPCVRLDSNSEVIVAPKDRHSIEKQRQQKNLSAALSNVSPTHAQQPSFSGRVVAIEDLDMSLLVSQARNEGISINSVVFLHKPGLHENSEVDLSRLVEMKYGRLHVLEFKSRAGKTLASESETTTANLRTVPGSGASGENPQNVPAAPKFERSGSVFVRVLLSHEIPRGHIAISKNLRGIINASPCQRVRYELAISSLKCGPRKR